MSTLHLGVGSEKPADVENEVRLYSMKFCPFAHRIRLILNLKNIPHNIVNINLKNKPEWYFQIHPEGKVPAIVDTDGKVIVDSVTIANYLDEKYPDPPLYQKATKARDLELLDHFGKIISIFANCIYKRDKRPFDEIVAEISDLLLELENELKIRGTPFFGGDNPNMLDILIWPWVERGKSLPLIYNQPFNFDKEKFSCVIDWITNMKNQQFVQENAGSYEEFARHMEMMLAGSTDYDDV